MKNKTFENTKTITTLSDRNFEKITELFVVDILKILTLDIVNKMNLTINITFNV